MTRRPGSALVEHPDDDVPLTRVGRVSEQDDATRERWAQVFAARLDKPMSALGIIFLLVVLGQELAQRPPLQTALAVAGWVLWAIFVAEFAFRAYIAPSRIRFFERNWWQAVFLVVPFLRFLRLVAVLRVARVGRVLSSAVRSSRSAARILSSRLGWLAAVSVIVVLSSSQLLYAFDVYEQYGDALHAAALATIAGEPLGQDDVLARVLEVLLVAYSVGVFAVLAGTFGAYFLEERRPRET